MNILHINDKIEQLGGVETYISQLLNLSNSHEIQMYFFAVYESENVYSIKFALNQRPESISEKLSDLKEYIKDFCNKQAIDIIHVHSISNPRLLDVLFSIRPVVRTMHEPRMFCPGQGKFFRKSERICNKKYGLHCFYHTYTEGCCNRHPKRLLKAYKNVYFETKKASGRYSAIFVMSNYMYAEALKAGFKKDTLVLNPCFTPLVVDQQQQLYKISDTIKSLVYVGRLSRTKGLHYAIKSVVSLLDQGYNVRFDIVGSGQDENYFRALVPKNYSSQFVFHGWQDRIASDLILSKAFIVLFPSIYPEAFGISGIEAMMRSKPVVGFNVGGVSTWLKDQETGFLVNSKNYLEMAQKVKYLIDNPLLYKRLSCNSRYVAMNEFSEKKHVNLLKLTYKKALIR